MQTGGAPKISSWPVVPPLDPQTVSFHAGFEPRAPMEAVVIVHFLSAALCGLLLAAPGWAETLAAPLPQAPILAAPAPFSFDLLAQRAQALARAPYVATPVRQPEVLEKIDYDAHWKIKFRPEMTLRVGDFPVQFFHMGTYFRQPVRMYLVENGAAREVRYARSYFDLPEDSPALALSEDAGFAGFRVMHPDLQGDWVAFLGASYFRTEGALGQYGLSARGLAVDTGLPTGEEFPRFTEIYFEPGTEDRMIVTALLEGRRVTGAYRMVIDNAPGKGQRMDVESRLFVRAPIERLGIAPLTSMFWYSETNRITALDWRPEVHDSDGLMMVTEKGEQIWRPLDNPAKIVSSRFEMRTPKGFGLLQRDRNFDHYQDDGVFYDRRPTAWIEPLSDWGAGAVELVELPTHDEIYDNTVAFWTPAKPLAPGEALRFDYRLSWVDAVPVPPTLARVVATRVGMGGNPGQSRPKEQIKVVLDFEGDALAGLSAEDAVMADMVVPKGAQILNLFVHPLRDANRWRLFFDVKTAPGVETVVPRVRLVLDGKVLSETWTGPLHPEMIEARR